MYTVTTSTASLLWSLSREAYKVYLTVISLFLVHAQLDTEQEEARKAYDQKMFHWVNTNQLPLSGMKLQVLKLISEVFGGRLYAAGETIWTPDMKAKKLSRVIVTGKGIVGAEAAPIVKDTDNEFDVDLSGWYLNRMSSSDYSFSISEGCWTGLYFESIQ